MTELMETEAFIEFKIELPAGQIHFVVCQRGMP
jgi:hypothetical protein